MIKLTTPLSGSTIPATDAGKMRSARKAGKFIVEQVLEDRRPSQLITKDVLENAIMYDMAVGGSTNLVLHILAYAYELDIDLSLDDFDKYIYGIGKYNDKLISIININNLLIN